MVKNLPYCPCFRKVFIDGAGVVVTIDIDVFRRLFFINFMVKKIFNESCRILGFLKSYIILASRIVFNYLFYSKLSIMKLLATKKDFHEH